MSSTVRVLVAVVVVLLAGGALIWLLLPVVRGRAYLSWLTQFGSQEMQSASTVAQFLVNLAVFLLSVVALIVAIRTLNESIASGRQTNDALTKVVDGLNTATGVMDQSRKALAEQLEIVRAERQETLTKRARQARLDLSIETNGRRFSWKELQEKRTEVRIGFDGGATTQVKFVIENGGDGELADPEYLFTTVPKTVQLSTPQILHRGVLQAFGRAGGHSIPQILTVPADVDEFLVTLQIQGREFKPWQFQVPFTVVRPPRDEVDAQVN
jgi:hypothetical protein